VVAAPVLLVVVLMVVLEVTAVPVTQVSDQVAEAAEVEVHRDLL
jgi:hypothetical protein